MSVCTPCKKTKLLPSCLTELVIGIVGAALTDYFIYLKDISTGYVRRISATSDADALLKMPNTEIFSGSHSYELWVTLASAASEQDKEDVTIADAADVCTCFALRAEDTFTDGALNTFTSVTLTEDLS